jgi:DNA-binding response OmpR family regulator
LPANPRLLPSRGPRLFAPEKIFIILFGKGRKRVIEKKDGCLLRYYSDETRFMEQPRLLIIDDDQDLIDLLTETFESQGYAVDCALDVGGASEFLDNGSPMPDVIILDLVLPDGDGYELCKRITANDRTRAIPVVLLTAKTSLNNRVRGFVNGARKYITKPFDIDHLLEAVEALLPRDRAESDN